jgi:hypothetical protein
MRIVVVGDAALPVSKDIRPSQIVVKQRSASAFAAATTDGLFYNCKNNGDVHMRD